MITMIPITKMQIVGKFAGQILEVKCNAMVCEGLFYVQYQIKIINSSSFVDIEFLKKKWDISKEKFRRIRKRMIRSDQPSLANEWPLYHVMHNYFDQFIKTRKYN